jgi:hypothetical protein
MPDNRNDAFSFVHGHGARYFSDHVEHSPEAPDAEPVSPVTLERVRLRAAAQLALQRVAIRTLRGG